MLLFKVLKWLKLVISEVLRSMLKLGIEDSKAISLTLTSLSSIQISGIMSKVSTVWLVPNIKFSKMHSHHSAPLLLNSRDSLIKLVILFSLMQI
jgi:hypothetical protein